MPTNDNLMHVPNISNYYLKTWIATNQTLTFITQQAKKRNQKQVFY